MSGRQMVGMDIGLAEFVFVYAGVKRHRRRGPAFVVDEIGYVELCGVDEARAATKRAFDAGHLMVSAIHIPDAETLARIVVASREQFEHEMKREKTRAPK